MSLFSLFKIPKKVPVEVSSVPNSASEVRTFLYLDTFCIIKVQIINLHIKDAHSVCS